MTIKKAKRKLPLHDYSIVKATVPCPKCKQETLIEVKDLQLTVIKEPDAQPQSR